MSKNVLIIWQEIPESCKFYLVNCDDEEYQILKDVNDHYINSEDDKDIITKLDKVSDALCDDIDDCFTEDKDWHSKWVETEIKLPFESNIRLDMIVTCGFIL